MDFNTNTTKGIYSDRAVSDWWKKWAQNTIHPKSKIIADIGCGGGIYSKGFFQLGASTVIMVDSSEKYIAEAKENLSQYHPIFKLNDCTNLDIVRLMWFSKEQLSTTFRSSKCYAISEK